MINGTVVILHRLPTYLSPHHSQGQFTMEFAQHICPDFPHTESIPCLLWLSRKGQLRIHADTV